MREITVVSRRKALWLMGGLAGGLMLHGCSKGSTGTAVGNAAAPTITVGGVPWIGYSPLYVADAKGFFKDHGATVEVKVFSANGDNLSTFAAGKLVAQAATNPEIVTHAARGVDYRIVQMADASLGGDGILARSSVKDLADFKGRKVGVEIGSTSYYFLIQALKEKANLSIKDIEVVNIAADASAAAYQAGSLEIAVTYSPFLQKSNQAQPDGRIILDTSALPTAIVDLYIFQPDYVAAHPDAVQAFVDGIYQGRELIKNQPEEAYPIIAKKLDISEAEVAEQLQGVDLTSPETNLQVLSATTGAPKLADNLATLSQFLATEGQIEKPLTSNQTNQLIEASFIQQAKLAQTSS